MRRAGLASARGVAVGLAAGGLGAAALLHPGSLGWGALWPAIVLAACLGYGRALERATGQAVGPASTVVCGLAVLATVSAVLGQLGVLGIGVQIGAVGAGLLGCGIAPIARGPAAPIDAVDLAGARRAARIERLALAGGGAVVIALAAIAAARLDLVVRDGVNHTFVIKRLWDTGALGRLPHQLGAQVAAEAYFALATGPHGAAILQNAVAPALLAALLFERLGAARSPIALSVFLLLATPIVVLPTFTPEWLGAALHVAMFFALGEAIAAGRIGWHAIACAIALPSQAPRPRRASHTLAVGWTVALVGFQLVLGVPPKEALVNAAVLLAAWPVTRAMLALLGDERPRDALAVLCFAVTSWGLAVALDAVRPAQHDAAASAAMWLSLAVCVAAAPAWGAPAGRPPARLRLEVVAVVLALFLGARALAPSFGKERGDLLVRLFGAIDNVEYRAATAAERRPHRALRALQERLPAGAAIGFWGRSAAALDFTRNRIVDISWPVTRFRDEYYLQPIELHSLRGKDYVLVERLEIAPPITPPPDRWDLQRPTGAVEGSLERIACIDAACAYAVRR
jgi:hypothetical protein